MTPPYTKTAVLGLLLGVAVLFDLMVGPMLARGSGWRRYRRRMLWLGIIAAYVALMIVIPE